MTEHTLLKDMIGTTCKSLIVTGYAGRLPYGSMGHKMTMWWAKCSQCGGEAAYYQGNLRGGRAGCKGCARLIQANAVRKHGRSLSKAYGIWNSLKHRNMLAPQWECSTQFLKDVGVEPSPDHVLIRIDKSKPYEPGNVKWVLRSEKKNEVKRAYALRAAKALRLSPSERSELVEHLMGVSRQRINQIYKRATK